MRRACGERVARVAGAIARGAELCGGCAATLEGGVSNRVRGIQSARVAERERFAVE
jgi:hypothetical protein